MPRDYINQLAVAGSWVSLIQLTLITITYDCYSKEDMFCVLLSGQPFCFCTGIRWVRRPRHQKLSPAMWIDKSLLHILHTARKRHRPRWQMTVVCTSRTQ